MTYTQITSSPDGESRFEDVPLLSPIAWEAKLVRLQPVPPGRTSPLRREPEPTLATVLTGWIEISTSLGVTKRFGPGQAMGLSS